MEATIEYPKIHAGDSGSGFVGSKDATFFCGVGPELPQTYVDRKLFRDRVHAEAIGSRFPPMSLFVQDDSLRIFNAIQSLYLSRDAPRDTRDRRIADRLATINRDVVADGDRILPEPLEQLSEFFLKHPKLRQPFVTATPDGTVRARWIQATGTFTAIEFMGGLTVKLVAEVSRPDGETASYFGTEHIDVVMQSAIGLGASFE